MPHEAAVRKCVNEDEDGVVELLLQLCVPSVHRILPPWKERCVLQRRYYSGPGSDPELD